MELFYVVIIAIQLFPIQFPFNWFPFIKFPHKRRDKSKDIVLNIKNLSKKQKKPVRRIYKNDVIDDVEN